MKIVKKYKDGWSIREDAKGRFWLYDGKMRDMLCDSLKDARFIHYARTH